MYVWPCFLLTITLYILLCSITVNHLLSCPCSQDGMTPLDVANVMGSDESAELLKEAMVYILYNYLKLPLI